jgi:hypothetical protein
MPPGRIPPCNAIDYNDGTNLSVVWSAEGEWCSTWKPCCNKRSVVVGLWHRKNRQEKVFAYLCSEHFDCLKELDFDDWIHPWFEVLGYVKRADWEIRWAQWR